MAHRQSGLRALRPRGHGVALLAAAGAVLIVLIVISAVPWSRPELVEPQNSGRVSEITANPVLGTLRAANGADRLLQRERTGTPCGGVQAMGCPLSVPLGPVPFFLVRDSTDVIRAFIGEDPRNGCRLVARTDLPHGVFYDPCHGSIYDRDGRVVGGPSPWNLNEWAVEIRDGVVFVDPSKTITGEAPGLRHP